MNVATATPVSSNRRVFAAAGFAVIAHALVLSGWHLRIFTPPRLASMEPIEVSLVTEHMPRLERRTPPRTTPKPKPTPQPMPAEKVAEPEPQPVERAEAAPEPTPTSPP